MTEEERADFNMGLDIQGIFHHDFVINKWLRRFGWRGLFHVSDKELLWGHPEHTFNIYVTRTAAIQIQIAIDGEPAVQQRKTERPSMGIVIVEADRPD